MREDCEDRTSRQCEPRRSVVTVVRMLAELAAAIYYDDVRHRGGYVSLPLGNSPLLLRTAR